MKISSVTIARTVVFVFALVNQVLSILGYKIIPIEDEQVNDFITMLFTIASALAAWWKNNSFTEAAIEGDKYKDIVKEKQNQG